MQEIENNNTNSIFENIKHIDEYNNDFWYTRELQRGIRIQRLEEFSKCNRAKESCKNSKFNLDEQLVEVNKLSKRNNNAVANIQDFKLSRYICYLIVQNADPKKEFDGLEKYYK